MLISDECLDLDGDAVASGRGRRYARKQLLTAPGDGGAVCGRMPMLSDEQSDESLLWHPPHNPRTNGRQLAPLAGAGTRTRTDKLPGQNDSAG
jgi:hypothetical protein